MLKKVTVALGCVGILASCLYAQLLGGVVFDPTQSVHAISQIAQYAQQIQVMTNLYNNSMLLWNRVNYMSQMLKSKQGFLSTVTPWSFPTSPTAIGSATAWINAVNTGAGSLAGYQQAVGPVPNYAPVLTYYATATQTAVNQQTTRLQVTDAVTANAMATTGNVRATSAAMNNTIASVEAKANSTNPDDNTEIGVLNTMSAADAVQLRQQQEALQLHAVQIDLEAAQLGQARAQTAQDMNNDILMHQSIVQTTPQLYSGASATVQGFNIQ